MRDAKANGTTWTWRLTKVVITVAVLAAIMSQISWHDYAILENGHRARVLGRNGDTLLVQTSSGSGAITQVSETQAQLKPGMQGLLHRARVHWLGFALAIQLTTQFLLITRWSLLLTIAGEKESFVRLTVWQCRAQIFGLMFFGQLGSDVIRIQQSLAGGHKPAICAGVVIVERLIGLTILLGLALYGCIWHNRSGFTAGPFWLTCSILLVSTVAATTLLPRFLAWATTWRSHSRFGTAVVKLARDGQSGFELLFTRPWQIMSAATLTLGIHLTAVAAFIAVDFALSCDNSWSLYLAVVPLVTLAACLPSFNGFVVYEGSAIVLLNQLGNVPATTGLIICAALRLVDLLFRLIQITLIWMNPNGTLKDNRDQSHQLLHRMDQQSSMTVGGSCAPSAMAPQASWRASINA